MTENVPIGYLRKIEIAMALATNPKLILLDEPFSGLTDLECEELSGLIRELYPKVTLIVIDHKLKHLMLFPYFSQNTSNRVASGFA